MNNMMLMKMGIIKAQIAVETLAVLSVFLILIIALTTFVYNTSTIYLKSSSYESERASLYNIKFALEEAYTQCPYYREMNIRFGPNAQSLLFLYSSERNEFYLLLKTDYGEIYVPVNLVNHNPYSIKILTNIDDDLSKNIRGNHNVYVKCTSQRNKFKLSIGMVK